MSNYNNSEIKTYDETFTNGSFNKDYKIIDLQTGHQPISFGEKTYITDITTIAGLL